MIIYQEQVKKIAMKLIIQRIFLLTLCMSYKFGFSQGISATVFSKHTADITGSLSGKIVEKNTGSPLASATVYISDLKIGAVADTSGHYAFKSLPSGTYLVEVRIIGFKAVTKNIVVNGDVIENFELTDNAVEESVVVVTGLSKATQVKRSPIPIIAVTHEYLIK